MSSLALDKEISSVEKMKLKRETGEKSYPIWLLFNPKHPAIRHYIWTPILAEIQDKVYRVLHTRINTTDMYIRNVVSDSGIVPNTLNWWGTEVSNEIELLRELVNEHQPKILISFGAFPFEFVRRVYDIKPEKGPKAWGTSNLGDEFGRAMKTFDINTTNRIPLLRRVVDSGKFIEEDSDFCKEDEDRYFEDVDNYFHFVGSKIAEKIIEYKDSLDIWI